MSDITGIIYCEGNCKSIEIRVHALICQLWSYFDTLETHNLIHWGIQFFVSSFLINIPINFDPSFLIRINLEGQIFVSTITGIIYCEGKWKSIEIRVLALICQLWSYFSIIVTHTIVYYGMYEFLFIFSN